MSATSPPPDGETVLLSKCRVLYIGSAVPMETAYGIESLQMPLRERYFKSLNKNGSEMTGIDAVLSVYNSGLLMTYVDDSSSSAWFPIRTLNVCAAVKAVTSAPETTADVAERTVFASVDSPEVDRNPTPPIFAAIMRRTRGIKVLECHAFVCRTSALAMTIVQACARAYDQMENGADETDAKIPMTTSTQITDKSEMSGTTNNPATDTNKFQTSPLSAADPNKFQTAQSPSLDGTVQPNRHGVGENNFTSSNIVATGNLPAPKEWRAGGEQQQQQQQQRGQQQQLSSRPPVSIQQQMSYPYTMVDAMKYPQPAPQLYAADKMSTPAGPLPLLTYPYTPPYQTRIDPDRTSPLVLQSNHIPAGYFQNWNQSRVQPQGVMMMMAPNQDIPVHRQERKLHKKKRDGRHRNKRTDDDDDDGEEIIEYYYVRNSRNRTESEMRDICKLLDNISMPRNGKNDQDGGRRNEADDRRNKADDQRNEADDRDWRNHPIRLDNDDRSRHDGEFAIKAGFPAYEDQSTRQPFTSIYVYPDYDVSQTSLHNYPFQGYQHMVDQLGYYP